jgi:hypothetical protein
MMSSPQHPQASANNLQTRRPPGGMTSSAWQTSARVALFGMVVNSIFAVAKILGGVFGHAYVLIADGIESGLDIAGSFVIWSTGRRSRLRPRLFQLESWPPRWVWPFKACAKFFCRITRLRRSRSGY